MNKRKMIVVTDEIPTYKPPTAIIAYKPQKEVKDFVMPEIIEPEIIIAPSGQERRRERRKQTRKK